MYLPLWVVKSISPVARLLGTTCDIPVSTRGGVNHFMLNPRRYLYGS